VRTLTAFWTLVSEEEVGRGHTICHLLSDASRWQWRAHSSPVRKGTARRSARVAVVRCSLDECPESRTSLTLKVTEANFSNVPSFALDKFPRCDGKADEEVVPGREDSVC